MLNQDEQIAQFVDAINENAQKICKQFDKEAKKLYATEIEKIQSSVREQMKKRVSYSKNEIETRFNKELAMGKSQARQSLCNKRQEITESVFEEVKEKIKNFTKEEEYLSFLESSLKTIYSYIDAKANVYANEMDGAKVRTAAENLGIDCNIITDNSILLGGVRVECESCGKVFDDTLDCRLEEQKDWFYANSNLPINI